jgi:hypothetical protein
MGETGMVNGSSTQGGGSGKEKEVKLYSRASDPVVTDHTSKHANTYAVRVSSGADTVLLKVDTDQQAKRSKIKAANASIRRRSRG